MRVFLADLRHALRTLTHSPGYASVAILSLALGVAGTATVFTVVNALLFKPLPVGEPARTVSLYTSDYSGPLFGTSSYPDLLAFRQGIPALDHIVGMGLQQTSLTIGAEPVRVTLAMVSEDHFSGLGIPLALGRGFSVEENQIGGAVTVVVLSHALWTSRFHRRPEVVGQAALVGGRPFTVIGVARPGFSGLMRGLGLDGWVPLAAAPLLRADPSLLTNRGDRGLMVIGHLAPGATLAQARAQADGLSRQLHADFAGAWTDRQDHGRTITLLPEGESRLFPGARGPVLGVSALLFLVVLAVLLIACGNVASLFLARAMARQREVAVRLALGASRGRVVRQLVTESVVLATLGGVLGGMLSFWLAGLLLSAHLPIPVTLALNLAPDLRVLGFALLLSIVTGLLVGLAPALQASRPELLSALKDNTGGSLSPRSRLRGGFVIGQAALSILLLVMAGLFLRSLQRASSIDLGFGARNGLVLATDLGLAAYDEARVQRFQHELLHRSRTLPGVTAAGLTGELPLSLFGNRSGLTIEGYVPQDRENLEVGRGAISPGYLEALELPVLRGRAFTDQDRTDAPLVALVSEAFARRYWPGLDPIGHRVSTSGEEGPWREVVGVVHDAKYSTLGEELMPYFYLPVAQINVERTSLLLRTHGVPAALIASVRALVHDLDPALPVEAIGTFQDHLSFALLPARAGGLALGAFGLLGLLLASLGVYGVVAYGVAQRRREIGIRIALGAKGGAVVRMMVRDGLRLVSIGLGIGLLLAGVSGFLVRGLLYGLTPLDPVAFIAGPLVFGLVALGASYLPARRATRIDPMAALRAE
ncbi:MAG: ABC transporter permease [Gemmatimonadales bacterium]